MKYGNATLGQVEAVWNKLGGEDGVNRFLADKVKIIVQSILTLLRMETISTQPAVTTSEKYFQDAGVKWANDTFKNQFLGIKVEGVEEVTLSIHKLDEASLDAPILTELGDKAETPISTFREFLRENHKSQEWFIFYLRGKDENLWAVSAYWRAERDGWFVHAHSVADLRGWDASRQVVSCN